MQYMLCRNKVRDYEVWKHIFDSHAEAHLEAGLKLVQFWRSLDDKNDIYFLFEIHNMETAKAFISQPDSEDTTQEAGVIEGEYHYVEDADGYQRMADL